MVSNFDHGEQKINNDMNRDVKVANRLTNQF